MDQEDEWMTKMEKELRTNFHKTNKPDDKRYCNNNKYN